MLEKTTRQRIENTRALEKTLVHGFHISYSHTKWYLFLLQTVQLQLEVENLVQHGRNEDELVNLYNKLN